MKKQLQEQFLPVASRRLLEAVLHEALAPALEETASAKLPIVSQEVGRH